MLCLQILDIDIILNEKKSQNTNVMESIRNEALYSNKKLNIPKHFVILDKLFIYYTKKIFSVNHTCRPL